MDDDARPAAPEVLVRDASPADVAAITAIYNHAVLHTTATWDLTASTVDDRRAWFDARTQAGLPVLVAVDPEGRVVGYASYGPFRNKAGYAATVEHSVYVTEAMRGAGIGERLVAALVDRAAAAGVHVMVGGVSADNEGSLRFHERLGFERVALLRSVGRKFGRWLDLVYVHKMISGEPTPRECTDEPPPSPSPADA